MTLPLDEIRNIRFPMARKPQEDGYRASAVDNFIDRVEISYAKLIEDNESLRAQVTSGGQGADPEVAVRVNELEAELEKAHAELEAANATKNRLEANLSEMHNEDEGTSRELAQLREASQSHVNELATAQGEVVQARQEAESAFEQLKAKNEELAARTNEIVGLQASLTEANDRVAAMLNAQGDADTQREIAWQDLNAQLAQLKEANNTLTAELNSKNSELESLSTQLHEAKQVVPEPQAPVQALDSEIIDGVQRIEVSTTEDASPWLARMVQLSTEQAETLLAEATSQAEELRRVAQTETDELRRVTNQETEQQRQKAQNDADEMVNSARAAADALNNESIQEAERLIADANHTAQLTTQRAQEHADGLTAKVDARREELFNALQSDQVEYSKKIEQLKSYESNYRTEIQAHLRKLLDRFGKLELSAQENSGDLDLNTVTPRLDKLLGGE